MKFAVALVLSALAIAFGGDVVELDPKSFPKMLQADELYVVAFTAPWCGHCQRLKPEYAKAATALKGIAKVANVDMDRYKELGGPYGIQGFPTIKIFGDNKNSPSDFNGQRDAKSIVDAVLSEARKVASARLGGRSGSGSGKSGSKSKGGKGGKVIEAGESDFQDVVIDADELAIVAFTAPWCGHCQRLHPEFERAASEMQGENVKFVNVDATQHGSLAGQYQVQGYPTIKVFQNGKHEDYQGGRSASDFVEFAKTKLLETRPPPEVKEITDNDVFTDACTKHQLCFVSFVPDILDTQASGRNALIDIQKALAEKNKARPFGWVWTSAGTQPALQRAFNVGGSGFPALVAVNSKKQKFATLTGAFTTNGVQDFINRLVAGRQPTSPIVGGEMPQASTASAWDGSDGEAVFEEEFDLSDLDDIELDDENKDEL